ncbi:MAG: hypothetical protein ACFE0I_19295 [Elainellaceae cyanobacterium]
MEMPPELKPLISNLSPEESDELSAFIARLPADDDEIRRLIFENLDGLIRAVALNCPS